MKLLSDNTYSSFKESQLTKNCKKLPINHKQIEIAMILSSVGSVVSMILCKNPLLSFGCCIGGNYIGYQLSKGLSFTLNSHTKIQMNPSNSSAEVHLDRNLQVLLEKTSLSALRCLEQELLDSVRFLIQEKDSLGISEILLSSYLLTRSRVSSRVQESLHLLLQELEYTESESRERITKLEDKKLGLLVKLSLRFKLKRKETDSGRIKINI